MRTLARPLRRGFRNQLPESCSSIEIVRSRLRAICEKVEDAIDGFDDVHTGMAQQLSINETPKLSCLSDSLCAVERVKLGEAGTEYLEVVLRVLEELTRCCDPIGDTARTSAGKEDGGADVGSSVSS